jgi:hypothetical protein
MEAALRETLSFRSGPDGRNRHLWRVAYKVEADERGRQGLAPRLENSVSVLLQHQ